jgi:hypothetical protein
LNHTLGGLLAIYDQHDYLDERRAALELWVDFLVACGGSTARQTPPEFAAQPIRPLAA